MRLVCRLFYLELHMFDLLPVPCVGEVDGAVLCLYDGRIAEFSFGKVLQHHQVAPLLPIRGSQQGKFVPSFLNRIANEQMRAIPEGHGIQS